LSDTAIIEIAMKVKDMVTYSILILPNNKYNLLYQNNQGNLNYIKALLHNSVILNLLKKIEGKPYDAILIDEFTPADRYFKYLEKVPQVARNVTLIQKGESEHIAIALSSVLARAAFLKEMRVMSKSLGRDLMKGASEAVDHQAAEIIVEKGEDILSSIAKLNFSNTLRAKNMARHLRKSVKPKGDSVQ
jgi:ribonuclease HIII